MALITLGNGTETILFKRSGIGDEWFDELYASRFTLSLSGWAPQSTRFFESIIVGIPPIYETQSDVWDPPFFKLIKYELFTVPLNQSSILNVDRLLQWAEHPHQRCDTSHLMLKELENRTAQLPSQLYG